MKNDLFFSPGLCLLFLLLINTSRAQEQFNLAGGIGSPEMLNIGLRMRVDQNQFGLNLGTNLAYKHDNFSVSGDFYHHFGGRSSHTSLRPWFFKSGITYMRSEDEWEERMNFVLVPRLGREFNISDQFGVALEAGFMLVLINRNVEVKERSSSGDLDLIGSGIIQASAGFKFFYRLL